MKFINTVTAFESRYFDPATITVRSHSSIDIESLLGFPVDDAQIKRLSGAPSESTIDVAYKDAWTFEEVDTEEVPPGLYFWIDNPTYFFAKNVIGLFQDGSPTKIGLYIKLTAFDKKSAPKRMAARMLAIIVREALALPGITRIKLLAAGGRNWEPNDLLPGERWGGYVAWPTYGFDMELLQATKAIGTNFPYYPPTLSSCQRVSDVLAVEGGRDYWRVAGDGWYMSFDLSSSSSPSIKTLDKELENSKV